MTSFPRRRSGPAMTFFRGQAWLLLVFFFGVSSSRAAAATPSKPLSLGLMIPDSPFFLPVATGFLQKCKDYGITCHNRTFFSSNATTPCSAHAETILELHKLGVDGIATESCGQQNFRDAMNEASNVTFVFLDSDLNDTERIAYVGTDQEFLGRTMARLLKQLRPEGGTFAIVCDKLPRATAFRQEITKDNIREDRANWYEVDYVERDEADGLDGFLYQMEGYAKQNPTALLFFCQTPMRHPNWTDFVDAHRQQHITYIGTDGSDYQLDYLSRRYVDGLIGQLPYEFGTMSAKTLYDYFASNRTAPTKTVIPTNLVSYNLIPLELPRLDVDENLLGNLKYTGIVCFVVVALSAIACAVWTVMYRNSLVVKAAQPFFLVMVAAGVLILSSALVPLSFDDGGSTRQDTETFLTGICMSIPWLAFTGFSITFSALFSKTWRINKIIKASTRHARINVTIQDVLLPFAVLMTLNFIVLVCWTVIDPLTYIREFEVGTDFWNREIASNGYCRSDHAAAYLVPLGLLNFGILCIACYQAFKARYTKSDFSEASYIGLTVFSMSQAFLTGIPLVVVVRNIPQAFYLVLTFLLFILSIAILALIFIPKIISQRSTAGLTLSEQRRILASSVRASLSSKNPSHSGRYMGSDRDAASGAMMRCPNCGFGGFDESGAFSLPVSPMFADVALEGVAPIPSKVSEGVPVESMVTVESPSTRDHNAEGKSQSSAEAKT